MECIKKPDNVWVWIEQENGTAKDVGFELLAPACSIARSAFGQAVAVMVGEKIPEGMIRQAASYGADVAIIVEDAIYGQYRTESFTRVFCTLAEKYKPDSILFGATDNGRDLAPRVAARLKTGLTADCTDLRAGTEGVIEFICPAFGGNFMVTITCPDHRPQMGTVRPGVFQKYGVHPHPLKVIRENIGFPQEEIRTVILESTGKNGREESKLEDAQIVVAGGRGMGGPEPFKLLEELAEELGGMVASSRPPVDLGWTTHKRMVGQTGKNIKPKLYIACGISGAAQHLSAVACAERLIAINRDRKAPIFHAADYGIVGDVMEVIPALLRELRTIKGKGNI